jgi:cell fate regulator YaaT (PSP1 superfamily)
LKDLIEELFLEIMGKLEDKISWYYFMGVYNLFKASSLLDETDFFSRFLSNFFYIARNSFSDSIANNTMEYLDILDFYYSYEKNRMEKIKAEIKVTTNSDKINFDLSSEEMEEFEEIFTKKIEEEILNFMQFLANQN